jgi:putative DNA primase/helicase
MVSRDQEVSAQRILEVGEHALAEAMTRAADWQRYDGRSKEWVATDAPRKVAATYRERVGKWRLPVLTGIIDAPTLRADGSILALPDYDPATGLLLDPCGISFPPVRDEPTREHAQKALAVLLRLIETFPFVAEADRSVALSAILTACIRRSLHAAPLHRFTAPIAGSGKSMLVDLASVIATGREAGVIAQGTSEQEFEKRLGALLLGGDPAIAIDNCEAPLGGELLCSMLTQQTVRLRILGRSEVPELPSNAFVTATGNNLVLVGDLTRRALLCRLDPKHERPELRTFATNPVQTAKTNRGRLVTAALTVLRAFHTAGRPRQNDQLGSFEQWSDWVRGALVWLGQADPVETMEAAREMDPRRDSLTAILTQWRNVIGEEEVPVRVIIERAIEQQVAIGGGTLNASKAGYRHPDFREVLLVVAGVDGAINGKRLGKWLAGAQGRIVQGMRVVRGGLSAGVQKWRVEDAP